ncbi:hypothetical protein Ddc_13963 [Ditylenchus destructor]|nr:hypothetical protein Ddc_13963 [Ditylenchus destructor]
MPLFNDFLEFDRNHTLYEFNVFRLLFDSVALVDTCLQVYNLVVMFIATPKIMADYRYYLVLQTACDLFFEFWFGLILAPRITQYSNCFAYRGPIGGQGMFAPQIISGTDSWIPWGTQERGIPSDATATRSRIAMGILFFLTSSVIFAQHYSYLYRLGAVMTAKDPTKNITQKYNRPIARLAGLLGVLTISGLVGFAAFNLSTTNEELREIMREVEAFDWVWWCIDVPANLMWFWIVVAVFIASQLVNLIGGIVIIRTIRLSANQLAPETYKIYMELSIVLLLQGAVPFICIFVPLFWMTFIPIVVVPLFYRNPENVLSIPKRLPKGLLMPTISKIGILLICLFPLINAMLNIVFIRPYRDFAKKLLRKILCCKKRETTGAVAPRPIQNTMSLTQNLNIPHPD